jgi:hypothetical protein
MLNDQSPRMQANSQWKRRPAAVLSIADNREAVMRKLQTNLVLPTGY